MTMVSIPQSKRKLSTFRHRQSLTHSSRHTYPTVHDGECGARTKSVIELSLSALVDYVRPELLPSSFFALLVEHGRFHVPLKGESMHD
jgi:hypothetical protein